MDAVSATRQRALSWTIRPRRRHSRHRPGRRRWRAGGGLLGGRGLSAGSGDRAAGPQRL